MLTDPVSISIAPVSARVDTCELCATGPESLRSWIVVRHARGGTVQLAVCDRCGAAVRRIIAITGGATPAGPAQVITRTHAPRATAGVALAAVDLVGAPVLIHKFSDPFVGQGRTQYTVVACGQRRSDGTWIGWLEFVGPAGQNVRRSGRETTQSNREHLVYWATGLEPTYFEGAFSRAS